LPLLKFQPSYYINLFVNNSVFPCHMIEFKYLRAMIIIIIIIMKTVTMVTISITKIITVTTA